MHIELLTGRPEWCQGRVIIVKTSIPFINWRMWAREPSATVLRAMSDHEMVPSSWASLRMEAYSADSIALGMSGEFECEGYLEAT